MVQNMFPKLCAGNPWQPTSLETPMCSNLSPDTVLAALHMCLFSGGGKLLLSNSLFIRDCLIIVSSTIATWFVFVEHRTMWRLSDLLQKPTFYSGLLPSPTFLISTIPLMTLFCFVLLLQSWWKLKVVRCFVMFFFRFSSSRSSATSPKTLSCPHLYLPQLNGYYINSGCVCGFLFHHTCSMWGGLSSTNV